MTRVKRAHKQLGIPEPVAEFRLYPEGKSGFWFLASVYATEHELTKAVQYWTGRRLKYRIWAHTQRQVEDYRNAGQIGVIYMSRRAATDNIVSHELFHATMWWLSHKTGMQKFEVVIWGHPVHERAAEAHGNMVSQFWNQYTQRFPRSECWGWEQKGVK